MHLVKMGTFTKMFSLTANNLFFFLFFFFGGGGGSLSRRYKAGRGMKMQGEN